MSARAQTDGGDDVVIAGGDGDVCLAGLPEELRGTVKPLVAGGAARRQRDAAAGAERGRAAGGNGRRGRQCAVASRQTDLPRSSAMRGRAKNAGGRLENEIEDRHARQQRTTERIP